MKTASVLLFSFPILSSNLFTACTDYCLQRTRINATMRALASFSNLRNRVRFNMWGSFPPLLMWVLLFPTVMMGMKIRRHCATSHCKPITGVWANICQTRPSLEYDIVATAAFSYCLYTSTSKHTGTSGRLCPKCCIGPSTPTFICPTCWISPRSSQYVMSCARLCWYSVVEAFANFPVCRERHPIRSTL